MSRSTRNLSLGAAVMGYVAMALLFLPALLTGNDARHARPADRLVVHEWGTFTSFAGSDGVNLEFRPLATNDLPPFIRRPWSPSGIIPFTKSSYVALQRMETPVTYFYTEVPRTVRVRVDFPQGLLTEWFPVVKDFEPGKSSPQHGIEGSAFLDWGAVRLTPAEQFADVRVRGRQGDAIPASLPGVADDDHYGRARETDSAIVETVDTSGGSHFEKFLFYRGLGDFQLPLKLAALGQDRFEVANLSQETSGAMLLVRIDAGRVRFARMAPIAPGAAVETELPSARSTVDQLAAAMVAELSGASLYQKEALAMVNTWQSSWFGEDGTRLLYLVPGRLTDELLPLTVDPAPDECVRVLVGRLETLTPEDCQRLILSLAGRAGEPAPAAEAVEAELASLGRFAEPAIQFVLGQKHDATTRARLEAILVKMREKN